MRQFATLNKSDERPSMYHLSENNSSIILSAYMMSDSMNSYFSDHPSGMNRNLSCDGIFETNRIETNRINSR
jgi:hypothetical protein